MSQLRDEVRYYTKINVESSKNSIQKSIELLQKMEKYIDDIHLSFS